LGSRLTDLVGQMLHRAFKDQQPGGSVTKSEEARTSGMLPVGLCSREDDAIIPCAQMIRTVRPMS